jgi:Cu+-exporting ATPase
MQYVDPVCGMVLEARQAGAESVHGTEHYYFCSTTCRDRFESNPAQFLGSTRSARAGQGGEEIERHEPPRTSIDGVTVPKFGTATSGGAEFELLPEGHDVDADRKKSVERKRRRT